MDKELKKNFINVFYLLLLQGLNYLAPLILLPYLMITLGPEKYGIIGFCQSVIQYFLIVVDFGFYLSATNRIAIFRYEKKNLSKVFWSTVAAKCILTFICLIIHVLLILTVPKFTQYSNVLNVLFLSLIGSIVFPVWLFQGLEKMGLLTVINVVTKLSLIPLTLIFVKKPNDFLLAATLQSVVHIVAGFLSFIIIAYYRYVKIVSIKIVDILNEMKEGWPVFNSSLAINLYSQGFILILGFYTTERIVGYYAAAEKVMRSLCVLVYVPIVQSFFPRISILISNNKVIEAKALFKIAFNICFFALFIVSFILFYFSDTLIKALGSDYKNSLEILKIISPATFAMGLAALVGQLGLVAFGNKIGFRNVYIFSSIAAILFVFILTNLFKQVGTSIALVLTEFISLSLMLFYAKGILKKTILV